MDGGEILGRRPRWRVRLVRAVAGGAAVAVALAGSALAGVPARAPSARGAGDPRLGQQWALEVAGVPRAWAATTGAGVRVGIVDTGVDLRHEDLAGKVVAHVNCIGAAGDPDRCAGSGQDTHGHGTHVAGIVAARRDNGRGVAGVAPDAQLVVAKALGADGSGSIDDIVAGIRWVVDHGARVVTLSVGGNYRVGALLGSSLQDGITYAWARGAVPVVATGNAALLQPPAGADGASRRLPALVVGAVGADRRTARYSGPPGDAPWAVLAPGGSGTGGAAGGVLSTFWVRGRSNQYGRQSGTSMATAHVAGAAALLLAEGRTPAEAVARILTTARPAPGCRAATPRCPGTLDVGAAAAG